MQLPLDISFHNLDASPAVTRRIQTFVDRLCRVHPQIVSCRVAVELQSRRHQQGNLYRVRIDVRMPNVEFVAGQHSGLNPSHADVYVAVRDAFDQMRRRLAAHAQQLQGKAQAHVRTSAAPRVPESAV